MARGGAKWPGEGANSPRKSITQRKRGKKGGGAKKNEGGKYPRKGGAIPRGGAIIPPGGVKIPLGGGRPCSVGDAPCGVFGQGQRSPGGGVRGHQRSRVSPRKGGVTK